MKIIANFIIQIAGKPKELVLDALERTKTKISEKNKNFKVLESHFSDIDFDDETKFFSGFLDIRAEFLDEVSVLDFVIYYNPTSIEIESPQKLNLTSNNFNEILNKMAKILLKKEEEIQKSRAYSHYLKDKYENKKK